jgi:cytochrome c553
LTHVKRLISPPKCSLVDQRSIGLSRIGFARSRAARPVANRARMSNSVGADRNRAALLRRTRIRKPLLTGVTTMTNRFHLRCSMRLWPIAAVALLCATPALFGVAHADGGDVARGQALAQANCTRCHVIDRSGSAGWTNAPSFASIARRPTTTMQSLESTITQPHMKMVNLPRSPDEAREIAAYIMSLKQ